MNVAIIPARGGSKRIPRKNIKLFCGKPIIAYSIEIAIQSKIFDKVYVATDDAEIAKIAVSYGAEVPFLRSKELSGDYIGTDVVVRDAIEKILDLGIVIDFACCIYPTAPLIQVNDLIQGLDKIKEGVWNTVLAATNFSYPIMRSFKLDSKGGLEMLFPENFETRSQDLEEAYHDAGQFYWSSLDGWLNPKPGFNKHTSIIFIPNWRVQDIDNLNDWKRAEFIFREINLLDQ